jgi:bacterioferritin (cytochrome b1)
MGLDRDEAIKVLNEIVELELAAAVRYTQYSLMVFGHGRVPITAWMRDRRPRRAGNDLRDRATLCGRYGQVMY